MSDYNNIDSEKKRTIIAIIFSVIIMGVIYVIIANIFGRVDNTIPVEETVKTVAIQ